MKFAEVQPTAPLRVVVVPLNAWADGYTGKPLTEVAVGLRFLSQQDQDIARREAEREAVGFYAQLRDMPVPTDPLVAIDIQNDKLMAMAVARGTCDPNDVTLGYFKSADETVPMALTPEGIRRIYDELVILHKGWGGGRPKASDEDVSRLGTILQGDCDLDDEDRKLCAYLLEKFGEPLGVARTVEDEEDDEPILGIARSA